MSATIWVEDEDELPKRVSPEPGMVVSNPHSSGRFLLVHLETGKDSWAIVNMDGRLNRDLWDIGYERLITWLNSRGLQEAE